MASNFLQYIIGVLRLIPFIFILVVAIIILVRTKSAGAILMVVGQFLNILVSIFYVIMWPILLQQPNGHDLISIFSTAGTILSILGYSLFGLGLLLVALKSINKKESGYK